MTIQEKARIALQARDAGDSRWPLLVMMLSTACRVSPADCEQRIEELAK